MGQRVLVRCTPRCRMPPTLLPCPQLRSQQRRETHTRAAVAASSQHCACVALLFHKQRRKQECVCGERWLVSCRRQHLAAVIRLVPQILCTHHAQRDCAAAADARRHEDASLRGGRKAAGRGLPIPNSTVPRRGSGLTPLAWVLCDSTTHETRPCSDRRTHRWPPAHHPYVLRLNALPRVPPLSSRTPRPQAESTHRSPSLRSASLSPVQQRTTIANRPRSAGRLVAAATTLRSS